MKKEKPKNSHRILHNERYVNSWGQNMQLQIIERMNAFGERDMKSKKI